MCTNQNSSKIPILEDTEDNPSLLASENSNNSSGGIPYPECATRNNSFHHPAKFIARSKCCNIYLPHANNATFRMFPKIGKNCITLQNTHTHCNYRVLCNHKNFLKQTTEILVWVFVDSSTNTSSEGNDEGKNVMRNLFSVRGYVWPCGICSGFDL